MRSASLLFVAIAFSPIALGSAGCNELLSALMGARPVLYDERGKAVEVPEGSWKPFLDKTIRLSDGTTFQYRDFDRLGPDFWAHYPNDWEPVARQIHDDLVKELDARGIAHSGVFHHAGNSLTRYAVAISGEDNPLGRISSALVRQGQFGFWHDLSAQMGIESRPSPSFAGSGISTSHLPLSWLGMQDCHGCLYSRTKEVANAISDDAVVQGAYLHGATGKTSFQGVEITQGPFRNDWAAR